MKKLIINLVTIMVVLFQAALYVFAAEDTQQLNREVLELYPGQSFRLALTDGNDSYICYTGNESIATVTQKGLVTAQSAGTTEIRCVISEKKTLKCTVNVKSGKSPESVVLTDNVLTMLKGESYVLGARVIPEKNDSYKKFISSDESVISVDQNGNIKAVNTGNAVVTVESESTAVSSACLIKVVEYGDEEDTLKGVSGVLYNAQGEHMQNTIVNLSNGEFNRNVRTNSSGVFLFDNVTMGSYVLTVYDRGLTNEGVSSNIAVSTGDIHLSCILSDTALAVLYGSNVSSSDNLRDIQIMQKNVDMNTGETYDITTVLTPSGAKGNKLVYRSEDTSVADVDETGRITALNEGGTVIYISNEDGTITRKMTVNVTRYGAGLFGVALFSMLSFIIVLIITVYFHLRKNNNE